MNKIIHLIGLFAIACAFALLAGCNLQTSSSLTLDPVNHTLKWKSYKNVAFTNLVATVGSNGVSTISIGSWASWNDPGVLNSASAGDVAVINAVGAQVQNGVTTGMAVAAMAAKSPTNSIKAP